MKQSKTNLNPEKAESDPDLTASERETLLRTARDESTWNIHTEDPTVMRYLIKHPSATIEHTRYGSEGQIYAVTAVIPKGLVGLRAKPSGEDHMSRVVSSGRLRRKGE